jgi:hypothetical protein
VSGERAISRGSSSPRRRKRRVVMSLRTNVTTIEMTPGSHGAYTHGGLADV